MLQQIKNCKSCKKEFVFLRTEKGKTMPTDFDSLNKNEKDNYINGMTRLFDSKRHTLHFATCPDANKYRREK